jgi:hypothetical protein
MKSFLYQVLLAVIGLSLSCISVFANQLGFAHGADWGSGRILFLTVGISILAMSLSASYFMWQKVYIPTTSSLLLVLVIYVFIVTAGQWTSLPESSQHYDELATAFWSGHLYLNVQPSAALLALPDPYDPQARKNDPALAAFIEDHAWDLSLYHGRFYMYWGPAPALILSIVKLIYAGPIGDQVLAFIFSWAALVLQTLLLVRIWLRFFSQLPVWTISLGVTTAGLIAPIIWMLNMPRIYQAAIFSCQFFLIGGLYFAYTALEEGTIHTGKLWIAGIFWAMAIASRATLLGSALFLIVTILFMLVRQFRRTKNRMELLLNLAAIVIPMAITLIALGLYNMARFGSGLEFGLRYQLTLSNLNKIYDQVFSFKYILPNLYNYLILPFQTQARFPFIKAQPGVVPRFLDGLRLDNYQTEAITGILFSAPFLLFIFWPAISLKDRFTTADRRMQSSNRKFEDPGALYRWISVSLLGASIISFSILQITFYVTMRYMADFTFTMAPLAVIGFWQGFSNLKPDVKRTLFSMGGIVLSWLSIGISILLVIGYSKALQNTFFTFFRYISGLFR